jgi:hypothetical protein
MLSKELKMIACPDFFGMVEQIVWISNTAPSFSDRRRIRGQTINV